MTIEELMKFLPEIGLAIGGVIGYGKLQQKVESQDEKFDEHLPLVRADIKRLDDKLETLTDFLLRQAREK